MTTAAPAQPHLHFVGVGGAGMSALAHLLLARGAGVSGCDIRESPATARLRRLGAQVWHGHDPAHLEGVDVLVVSRAVREHTPEIRAAQARGVPVRHRAALLGQVMGEGRAVAVVGTHGKTTTTAMVTAVLDAGGLDPTALVGADVPALGGNVRVGRPEVTVAEVDESDGSLLYVAPWAAVVTSLDLTDHADFYATPGHLVETFRRFLGAVRPGGFVLLCADHPTVRGLADAAPVPVLTYGLAAPADVIAEVQDLEGARVRAVVRRGRRRLGVLALRLPGRHNLSNALAAVAVGLQLDVPFAVAARALGAFAGVARRFEARGEVAGTLVVDDYAHNPVKVATVLRAARESWPQRRILVLFQPHRYSRTLTTHAQFAQAFADADEVVVTEIYPADEAPLPGVTARLIVDAIRAHRSVEYYPAVADAVERVVALARPGDLVLTLGAGDIWQAAEAIVARLRAREGGPTAGPAAAPSSTRRGHAAVSPEPGPVAGA
ncbi:MAG: UDP-N-acetylmuramate--L-alanine ligase [Armatimonadota bacterium]|nr:UDP-N-acetylmuramate--L-alanine ligase [Armatimonadota bacterium]MDR7528286.1 UDP-N-acetylmuramate--L-alanine ligase [Armatimonadota bacterium]